MIIDYTSPFARNSNVIGIQRHRNTVCADACVMCVCERARVCAEDWNTNRGLHKLNLMFHSPSLNKVGVEIIPS